MGRMLLVFLVGVLSAFGADRYFTGIGTADFNAAGNWDSGGVPAASDLLYFDTAVSKLSFSGSATNLGASFGGTGLVSVDTGANVWQLSDSLAIGTGVSTQTVVLSTGNFVVGGIQITNVSEIGIGTDAFRLRGCTLTSSKGCDIRMGANLATTNGAAGTFPFVIGTNNPTQRTVWNITGGTNLIKVYGSLYLNHWRGESENSVVIGGTYGTAPATVNVSGSGTVVSNTLWLNLGKRSGSVNGQWNNLLNITDGAKWFVEGMIYHGFGTKNNRITVSGAGSLLQTGGNMQISKNGPGGDLGNWLVVTNGASVVCGGSLAVGDSENSVGFGLGARVLVSDPGSFLTAKGILIGQGSMYTDLIVSNGATVVTTADIKMGNQNTGYSNRLVVTGSGSVFRKTTNNNIWMEGGTNFISVSKGGLFETAVFAMNKAGYEMTVEDPGSLLNVTGGGACAPRGSTIVRFRNGGSGALSGWLDIGGGDITNYTARVELSGLGTVVTNYGTSGAGIRTGSYTGNGELVVSNGAALRWDSTLGGGLEVGWSPGRRGLAVIDGKGSVMAFPRADVNGTHIIGSGGFGGMLLRNEGLFQGNPHEFFVGYSSTATGSWVRIETGATLDLGGINWFTIRSYTDRDIMNTVTNIGGVLQFAKGFPAMNFDPLIADFVMTNAVLSFRNCLDSDVTGNKGAKQFAKIRWQGENTFRLVTATNIAQSYVFGRTVDPSDYVNLDLFNGAKFNGDVTMNAGRLGLRGTNAIGGNLTLSAGASLQLSDNTPLTVSGTFSAAPDTVSATLSAVPQMNVQQTLITAGSISSFAPQKIVQVFDGKSYEITISATGNRIIAGYYTGTVIKLY